MTDSRHWAVEGLALVGSADQTIEPLLKTMHDDPSATGARAGRVQSGGVRHVHARAATHRGSAIIELHGRSCAGCSDSRLGIPGTERHHASAIAQRLQRLAQLVRLDEGRLIRQSIDLVRAKMSLSVLAVCETIQQLGNSTSRPMDKLNVVVALTTRDNDYQAEQAVSVAEMAARLGMKIQSHLRRQRRGQPDAATHQDHSESGATSHCDSGGAGRARECPRSPKPRSGRASAGESLTAIPTTFAELRRGGAVPVFSVSTDQSEVGRIQGNQTWRVWCLRETFCTSRVRSTARRRSCEPKACCRPSRPPSH